MLNFLVIDDFLENPMEVRNFALSSAYIQSQDGWQGLISRQIGNNSEESLYKMASYVSTKKPDWKSLFSSYKTGGGAYCGGFQALFENHNTKPRYIHTHSKGQWTGLLYLSLDEDCIGKDGTLLYRNKKYNIINDVNLNEEQRNEIWNEMSKDHSFWEVTAKAEMKFNRLVIINSRHYHTWSLGFGDSIENCRLLQIFNFVTD